MIFFFFSSSARMCVLVCGSVYCYAVVSSLLWPRKTHTHRHWTNALWSIFGSQLIFTRKNMNFWRFVLPKKFNWRTFAAYERTFHMQKQEMVMKQAVNDVRTDIAHGWMERLSNNNNEMHSHRTQLDSGQLLERITKRQTSEMSYFNYRNSIDKFYCIERMFLYLRPQRTSNGSPH